MNACVQSYVGVSENEEQVPTEWKRLVRVIRIEPIYADTLIFDEKPQSPTMLHLVFAINPPKNNKGLQRYILKKAAKLCGLFDVPLCWYRMKVENCCDGYGRVKYIDWDFSGSLDGKSQLYIGIIVRKDGDWINAKRGINEQTTEIPDIP